MNKILTNITKGIINRVKGKKHAGDFKKIAWLTEKIVKHQNDTTIKQISMSRFSMFYKRPYELLHTYKEIYVKEIYRFRTGHQQPLIIDCGANIGMSVVYFKHLYPNATIIAFEPDESNFSLLSKNVELNKLQNIKLHQSAVWVSNGTITFEANESEASRIVNKKDTEKKENTREVQAERLADLLATYKRVDFLKIDIEGAEWDVVRDCAPYLNVVENMFLEYHGKTHDTHRLRDLLQILHDNCFSVYVQNAADNLQHPFINRTTSTPFDVQLNLYCYKIK